MQNHFHIAGLFPHGNRLAVDFAKGTRVFGNGLGKVPQKADGLTVDRDPGDKRTARITWKMSKDAAGYIIRYGITPEKLYNQYQVMGKTELKINSLNRDVVYYFAIDVFNENGYTKGTHIIESK